MSEWKVNPTDGVTNNNNGTFSFDANAPYTVYVISYTADDGCKANYTYRLKIGCGGDTPEPYPDYKVTCIRGTDNGTDVVDGKKYSHPFLCCGKGKDDDMDSLYVDNISYNGSPVSTSKSNPTVINSWLSVYRTTSGGVCGKGALMYMYDENDTNDVRDVTITFTTSDANVCSSAPPAQEYGITNACPSWEVEVKQCKKCDVWCCVKDTKGNCHSYTAVAKPCSECSEYESCGGDCTSDCGEDPPGPSVDCDNVTADSTLDGYVTEFNSTLGTTISVSNTPCTYKYLKSVYTTVQRSSNTTIMWTLANVMSEITPKSSKCEGYFKAASKSTYGGIPSVDNTSKTVYENRINGGVAYAKYKYDSYESSNEMAENARAELRGLGISAANWGSEDNCGTLCFDRTGDTTNAPNPIEVIPNMWGNKSESSYDYTEMKSLVTSYPTIESIKNVDGNNYLPLLDKQACDCYFIKILGLGDCDTDGDGDTDEGRNRLADFIYTVTDVVIASGNAAKAHSQTKRPANDQYPLFNYLCDNDIEMDVKKYCDDDCDGKRFDDPDFCNCETNDFKSSVASYPSGHSYKAFMTGLCLVEAKGDNGKIDRITKYCYHRNVVRAHWHSDVLIGKLVASMDIGYINGYKKYHELLRGIK